MIRADMISTVGRAYLTSNIENYIFITVEKSEHTLNMSLTE